MTIFVAWTALAGFAGAVASTALRIDFVVHDGISAATRDSCAAVARAAVVRIGSYAGSAAPPPIRCHLYRSIETKGLATGYTTPCHSFSGADEIHLSLESPDPGAFETELAAMMCRRELGAPRVDALERGLAVYLSPRWNRVGGLAWAARLFRLEDARDLAVLLDNQRFRSDSPLVMDAVSSAFVAFLIETWGRDVFVRRYRDLTPADLLDDSLRASWEAFTRRLSAAHIGEDIGAPRLATPIFHRGFCHAHEGYNVLDGYGSAKSDTALASLARLGVDAISLTPFSYMPRPDRPIPLRFSDGPGSENDEVVVHAAVSARSHGMSVMLKPHLWLGRSWPGEVEMSSEDEWVRFFDCYYRWIRHYAMLAEIHGVEILCTGVELSKATVGHESEWESLFKKLRVVYSGELTYAANWGAEFESVTFWKALDFAAIDFYYPLADTDTPSDEELRAGAEAALLRVDEVARRYDVPVLIAEVGYTSSPSPWRTPHAESRRATTDERAQARCYEAFFTALEAHPRVAGVYWWKWPSDLDSREGNNSDFTPSGKLAERVVRRWFSPAP